MQTTFPPFHTGVAQCSNPVNEPQAHNSEKSPHLVLIIVVTCAISIMVTVVFILLIIPKVSSEPCTHFVLDIT